ncbi:MAG: TonB-dependent receptor [Steroidobacteraceae bacterium]|nr:TonB-dependent receptor [Steroidobacteraceae bacterium]
MSDRRRSVRLAAAVSSILSAPAIAAGAVAIALTAAPLAQAQETASQVTGFVVNADGQPISGARVEILHVPSGTTSSATTNASGQFSATGLRVGGPYRVTARAEGHQDAVVEDLYTQLAQRSSVTLVAQPIAQLAGVEVTGASERDVTIGAGSRFGAQDVQQLPSISRDIKDVVRLDPKAWVDPTNSDALEVAGVNNRYNSITIDGVRQSDDFGLNNNGYPTQRSPLSVDAIEAVSILSAPFSVEYSAFRGSTINVVTKSGTNEFTGSAFYFKGDDGMVGNRSKDRSLSFTFEEETYGGTFGGPIIKDRLFFFGSYEKLDKIAPQEFGPAGSSFPVRVAGVTQAEYDQIVQIAQSVYGFDVGVRTDTLPEQDEKILAKLDWNINDSHRASLAWQRTEGNEVITSNNSTSQNRISAPSNWYNRSILMESTSLQLFSDWNEWFSTELKLARKEVDTGQDSLMGTDFAEMQIRTPTGGTMFIGPDEFRHANSLTNDLDTVKLKGNFFLGSHTLTVGYEREMLDIFNIFVPRSQGQFFFNPTAADPGQGLPARSGIENFQLGLAQALNYSNAFSNNANDGAASFGYDVDSIYFQDEWQVTPDFKIQAGVRMDRFSSSDTPLLNSNFATRYGYNNLATLDGRDLIMPRIGFNWQWRPDTTIYGGWGLFGGGTPNVWVSNSFSNDGVTVVATNVAAASPPITSCAGNPTQPVCALLNVDGFDLPQFYLDAHSLLRGDGPVNALDPSFEIPSQYRWNLGVKHTLPWDIEMSADVIISRVKDEVLWQDIRLVQTGTAPDGRPIYTRRSLGCTTTPCPPDTRGAGIQDLLLTNTSQGEGTVFTIDAAKTWRTRAGRFDAYLAYGYQDIKDVNPGTSSTASSNWDNVAVSDPNNPGLSTSNYEIEHQFKGAFGWRKAFFGDYETSIALVGERRSGRPFSYTFGGGTPQAVWGDPRQAARQRHLFYVPASPTDVIYEGPCSAGEVGVVAGCTAAGVFTANNAAAATLRDGMEAYIVNQGLEKFRGRITPRNGFTSPWLSVLDLRLKQELPVWGRMRGALTLDVENLANLINSDWGQLRQVSFPYVTPVVDVNRISTTGCAAGQSSCYVYRARSGQTGPVAPSNTLAALPSVWKIQFGIRLEF